MDHASDPMPRFWMPAHRQRSGAAEGHGLLECWCFDSIILLLGGRAVGGRAAKTLLRSVCKERWWSDHSGEKWLDSATSVADAQIFIPARCLG